MISYGTEGDLIEYPLPNLGQTKIEADPSKGISEHTVQELSIQDVKIEVLEHQVLSIQIVFYHPNFGNEYGISIMAPVNYVPDINLPLTSYTLLYDDNGGSGCSDKSIHKMEDDYWGELCTPTRTSYTFLGWNTKADGTGSNFTNTEKATKNITIHAKWRKNKVNIKLNANGGSLKVTGKGYTIDADGKIKYNGSDIIQKIDYGSSLTSDGLVNWNNSSYLSLQKEGYGIDSNKVWNTKDNGTGTSFNQTTAYPASDFCDAKEGDCEVTLYANWGKIPTCSISITSPPSPVFNGWYKKDVSLQLNKNNATTYGIGESSGLTNKTTTFTATKQGSNTYYGHVENAYGSNNCSIDIKIDKNPPKILSYYNYYNNSDGTINCDNTGRAHEIKNNNNITKNDYYDAVWFLWTDEDSGLNTDAGNAYFNWYRHAKDGKWEKLNDKQKDWRSGLYDSDHNQGYNKGTTWTVYDILYFTMNDSPSLKTLPISYHLCDAVGNCNDGTVNYTIIYRKLTYNDNGGSGCNGKVKYVGARCSESWGTLCKPKRSGYNFKGWYTAKKDGTKITSSTVPAKSYTTVYARWKKK